MKKFFSFVLAALCLSTQAYADKAEKPGGLQSPGLHIKSQTQLSD